MAFERNIFDLFDVPTTSQQADDEPTQKSAAAPIPKSLKKNKSTSEVNARTCGLTNEGRSVGVSRLSATRSFQRLRELNKTTGGRGRSVANVKSALASVRQRERSPQAPVHCDSTAHQSSHAELATEKKDWICRRSQYLPSSAPSYVDGDGQSIRSPHKFVLEKLSRAVIKGETPQWTSGNRDGSDTVQQRIAKLSTLRFKRSTNPEALRNRIALLDAEVLQPKSEESALEATLLLSPGSAFMSSEVDILLSLSQNFTSGMLESRCDRLKEKKRMLFEKSSLNSSFEKVVAASDAALAVSVVVNEKELWSRNWSKTEERRDVKTDQKLRQTKRNKAISSVFLNISGKEQTPPVYKEDAQLSEDSDSNGYVEFETELPEEDHKSFMVPTRPTAEECKDLGLLMALCKDALPIGKIDVNDSRWMKKIEAATILTVQNQQMHLEWLKRETEREMVRQRQLLQTLIGVQKSAARRQQQQQLPQHQRSPKMVYQSHAVRIRKPDMSSAAIQRVRISHATNSSYRGTVPRAVRLPITRRLDTDEMRRLAQSAQANCRATQSSFKQATSARFTTTSSKETEVSSPRSSCGVNSTSFILIRTGNTVRKLIKVQKPTHLNSCATSNPSDRNMP